MIRYGTSYSYSRFAVNCTYSYRWYGARAALRGHRTAAGLGRTIPTPSRTCWIPTSTRENPLVSKNNSISMPVPVYRLVPLLGGAFSHAQDKVNAGRGWTIASKYEAGWIAARVTGPKAQPRAAPRLQEALAPSVSEQRRAGTAATQNSIQACVARIPGVRRVSGSLARPSLGGRRGVTLYTAFANARTCRFHR